MCKSPITRRDLIANIAIGAVFGLLSWSAATFVAVFIGCCVIDLLVFVTRKSR